MLKFLRVTLFKSSKFMLFRAHFIFVL